MNWCADSVELKPPAKRYRIGELVRHSPFSRQTIHNYTIMGLIREAEWTDGGHRLYDESVFDQLARIIELKRTKSLTEIRRMLREEQAATQQMSRAETQQHETTNASDQRHGRNSNMKARARDDEGTTFDA